jgi:hypothetical protein
MGWDDVNLEGAIRMTNEMPIRTSVYDLVKCAMGDKNIDPKSLLDELCQQHNIKIDMSDYTFEDGKILPVVDVKGVRQVLALLPGPYAEDFRQNQSSLFIYSMQEWGQVESNSCIGTQN